MGIESQLKEFCPEIIIVLEDMEHKASNKTMLMTTHTLTEDELIALVIRWLSTRVVRIRFLNETPPGSGKFEILFHQHNGLLNYLLKAVRQYLEVTTDLSIKKRYLRPSVRY